MPGVLPMKIIKLGTSSQSRIAQACDRCRSKKIRCDGIRPCCSQCANVGFECKTSDKLSRRAFPRGYTESLEERVRALEGEIRELKDLLDEKDEKIDMLSKMHSNNRRPSKPPSPPADNRKDVREDIFRVQSSPLLLNSETSDSYFMSASSGRAFIDTFKRRIQESGKSCAGFSMEPFLNPQPSTMPSRPVVSLSEDTSAPPRIFSDRCVNIFFQEWAPLFPVVHKPTFLRLYERFVVDPTVTKDNHDLAQLYLVFGIAGLSCQSPDEQQIAFCEQQWQAALQSILMDNTIGTLQCLVLAQLYCISTADYKRLQYYKAIAIGLSHRLGLHQSQKRFSFGVLSTETRLKVFWTLYTVDCFSAAILGLPKLLKEDDIYTEFPADVDDEYVTEKGFDPTLPGESTKISSALALFRAARIMTKVLQTEYPAAASYDLSLQSLTALDSELNEWSSSLPKHLKLTFVQDKPSTNITGNRSALLSLAYFYIRSLIHRPAIGSSLGSKASPSVISLANSSKHIIQIIQLLEERGMSFSFCVNKNEVLSLCGLSLLYQAIDLKTEGKLLKDNQRLICAVIKFLEKGNAPSAQEFKKIVCSMFTFEQPARTPNPPPSRRSSDNDMAAPTGIRSMPSPVSHRNQGLNASRPGNFSEDDLLQERVRRATLSHISSTGLTNYFGQYPQAETSRSEPAISPREYKNTPTPAHSAKPQASSLPKSARKPNLDYLSLSNTPATSRPHSPRPTSLVTRTNSHAPMFPPASASATGKSTAATHAVTDWETLLGSIDSGRLNIHDAMYGGPALSLNDLGHNHSLPPSFNSHDSWSPESWDVASLAGMHEYNPRHEAHSVLSFSEESMTSGEDFSDLGRTSVDLGHALVTGVGDGFLIDGIDAGFGSL